jgi:hypothetical protein
MFYLKIKVLHFFKILPHAFHEAVGIFLLGIFYLFKKFEKS